MLQSTHWSMSNESLREFNFCLSFCMGTDMDMDTCTWTWTHQGCHRLGSASERDPMIYREGNVIAMLIPMGLGFQGSGHMLHGKKWHITLRMCVAAFQFRAEGLQSKFLG